MRIRLWGTRGSIASAGPATLRYGGDTSCVEARSESGDLLILDAGSGIRPLGVGETHKRLDILLTHLHMDHIQGLPFFPPLLDPSREVHIWGPISTTASLRQRLARYLSPPLFPVRVRDLPNVEFHDVPPGSYQIGPFHVTADLIVHPGSTLGYRIEADGVSIAYLPDHEPALGTTQFPVDADWTSGFAIAKGVTALIHDTQYTDEEYAQRVGWGHTSISHLAAFTLLTGANRLVTFHHDPAHDDETLDDLHATVQASLTCEVVPGQQGMELAITA